MKSAQADGQFWNPRRTLTGGPLCRAAMAVSPTGPPSPQLAIDSSSLPGENHPNRLHGGRELKSPTAGGSQPGQQLYPQHGKCFGMTRSLPLSGHPRSHRECRVRPVLFRHLPNRASEPWPRERSLAKLFFSLEFTLLRSKVH